MKSLAARKRPVVDHEDIGFGELRQHFHVTAITAPDGQGW
jgi:hypothetical protein